MTFALAEKHMKVKQKKNFGRNRLVSVKNNIELVWTGIGFAYREYNIPKKDKPGQVSGFRLFLGTVEDFIKDNRFHIDDFNKILASKKEK